MDTSGNGVRHMVIIAEAMNPATGECRQIDHNFMDNGSDRTFVTEELARWLKLSTIDIEELSIPEPMLPFIIDVLWKSPERKIYRNDVNNSDNAYKFIRLCLEKVSFEQFLETAADRTFSILAV